MRSTLFITGASGFVGTNLVESMKSSDFRLVCPVRPGSDISRLKGKCEIRVIGRPEDLPRLFEEERPSGVIHLATLFQASHSYGTLIPMLESNVEFGTCVLEAASCAGTRWFLNIGTFWQNYCGEPGNPVNFYAATKEAFESIGRWYGKTGRLCFTTLALNDTYGPGDRRRKIFNLLREAVAERKHLDMSPGEQVMDMLYVDDVTDAIRLLASYLEQAPGKYNCDRFYISAEEKYTLRRLVGLFSEICGETPDISWGGRPYREREVMLPACCGKPLPGWKQKVSFREGLARFLKDLKKDE